MSEFHQEEQRRRQDDRWHIGKTLDLGHLSTTLMMAVAVFWFFSDMNTRITVMESKQANKDKIIDEIRSDIKEIKDLLWTLNSKD